MTDEDKDKAQEALKHCGIEEDQVYRHYKGGLYVVVAVSLKEDTLEPMITYRSNKKKGCWTRTMENWIELVTVNPDELIPRRRHRFMRVKE
jgi:hypothetical protein